MVVLRRCSDAENKGRPRTIVPIPIKKTSDFLILESRTRDPVRVKYQSCPAWRAMTLPDAFPDLSTRAAFAIWRCSTSESA